MGGGGKTGEERKPVEVFSCPTIVAGLLWLWKSSGFLLCGLVIVQRLKKTDWSQASR